jgi:hypothetical protein
MGGRWVAFSIPPLQPHSRGDSRDSTGKHVWSYRTVAITPPCCASSDSGNHPGL